MSRKDNNNIYPAVTTRLKISAPISFETFISQPPKVDEKLFNLWLYKIKAKYSNYDAQVL